MQKENSIDYKIEEIKKDIKELRDAVSDICRSLILMIEGNYERREDVIEIFIKKYWS